MAIVSDERAATIIFDQLLDDEWFMSAGQRNDDCVDYCIAACLQGMSEEDAWNQLFDWASGKFHKLVEEGTISTFPEMLEQLCEEHFERIWPYAKVWVRRNEWMGKLLHEYDFEEE